MPIHPNDLTGPFFGSTIDHDLAVLQSVLSRAVLWGAISANPVAAVAKPTASRTSVARALPPSRIEEIRARLGRADAALVSVLAYAGLRPGEALGLRWGDLRERTILVERAVALGGEKHTKTRRARSVQLLGPLATELAELRLAAGRPGELELVFGRTGRPWHDHDYRNWRRRVFEPAADHAVGRPTAAEAQRDPAARKQRAQIAGIHPYDLRHSFVSLMLQEGRPITDVAAQAGHSVETCARTYAHVLEELDPAVRLDASTAIRSAREAHVRVRYAQR